MLNHSRKWLICLAVATVVLLGGGTSEIKAQLCCDHVVQHTIPCQSPGCSGQVTFNVCFGGQYGG